MRFVFNVWKQTLKGVWETGKKKPLPESILNKLNFPKNGFHYRCFHANFVKVLRTSNCYMVVNLTRTKSFLV